MMQDRPRAEELLGALRAFLLDEFDGGRDRRKLFLLRVAANVAGILAREARLGPTLLAEQTASLAELLDGGAGQAGGSGEQSAGFERLSAELSARIARGEADSGKFRERVLGYLRANVAARLAVDNPGYETKQRA